MNNKTITNNSAAEKEAVSEIKNILQSKKSRKLHYVKVLIEDSLLTREWDTEQLCDLMESILAESGINKPLIVDNNYHVISGNHRVAAFNLLKVEGKNRLSNFQVAFPSYTAKDCERIEALSQSILNVAEVPVIVLDIDVLKVPGINMLLKKNEEVFFLSQEECASSLEAAGAL